MTIYDNFHGFLKLRVNIFHFDRTIWVKLDSSWRMHIGRYRLLK